jgi:hypothetical protein
MVGGSARRTNLERFWQYVPVFYLGALRDADDEFSPRSQFWGRLLKAMEIPPALENKVVKVFDLLNKKLLNADPNNCLCRSLGFVRTRFAVGIVVLQFAQNVCATGGH